MRIAYIILAHKNPEQLGRLVRTLSYPGVEFFVHVDGRRDQGPFEHALRGLARTHFIQRRVRIYVAGYPPGPGFGFAEAILSSLAEVVSSTQFDYVVLLTAQDYPIKPNHEIHAFFKRNEGREFLERFLVPAETQNAAKEFRVRMDRIARYHFEHVLKGLYVKGVNRIANCILPMRVFPPGFVPVWGSVHWRLTQPCARYIVDTVKARPDFVRFFRFANCPDEYIFHTLVFNSSFADAIVDDNLTFMDWPGTFHPKTLTMEHFDAMASSSKLFARKFDVGIDRHVLDAIDERLLTKNGPNTQRSTLLRR